MSSIPSQLEVQPTSPAFKNKKSKKKKHRDKAKTNGIPSQPPQAKIQEEDGDEGEDDAIETESPVIEENQKRLSTEEHGSNHLGLHDRPVINGTDHSPSGSGEQNLDQSVQTNGVRLRQPDQAESDPTKLLEIVAREREELRKEVVSLRRSLEGLRDRHDKEVQTAQDQVRVSVDEKEQAETQYRNLLGKVNTIRSQLGERLKADAEDLEQARGKIETLEEECDSLRQQNETRTEELRTLAEERQQSSKELSNLRNRSTLSQQNWSREREDLEERAMHAKEEFEAAKQAMQDWEVLAMEERSIRESMAEKFSELEEQVATYREAHEKAATERDSQALTVDGLQRALKEIQDARKKELREVVENSQAQSERLRKQLEEAQNNASEAVKSLNATKIDLERALPFEAEVKEKNLLIGKLRHEAVILNDHLTKALRYLKKGKPEDNIDKQLISNHFLHFVALDRTDPKKFQVLQIIAALLAWSDEQREQAGLARPGASNPSLRIPVSPWHRTPSTPALSTDSFPESTSVGSRKESLGQLWTEFLDQEAQEAGRSPKPSTPSESPRPTS